MKKMMFCLMLISSGVFGQSEMKTLWGKSNAKIRQIGVYVAPEVQYGQFDGKFQPFAGGSVMLQFNKKLAIGATGFSTVDNNTTTTSRSLQGGFGGLKLEYTPNPDALVHVSFPLMIGGGTTGLDFGGNGFEKMGMKGRNGKNRKKDDDDMYKTTSTSKSKSDSLRTEGFVVQPGIAIEANLFRYAKVFAGANYRLGFASGYSSTMSGLSANAGIKIGIFDYTPGKREKRSKGFRHNKKDK